MKEKKGDVLKEHIDNITTPIFLTKLGSPQADLSNSMTTTKKSFSYFFRPNNYRRQIMVKEKTNSTLQEIRGAISILPMELNINTHTKLISIKNYKPNITIQYGKNILTAIYSQTIIAGEKEIFRIERNSIGEVQDRINEIKQDIEKRVDNALKEFSHKFNLSMPFKNPVWSRYEDFIKGEEFIDKIPRECIIHDTFFKKVYGKGIEFKKSELEEPTIHLKNYIKNRAIEDIAPEISGSINSLGSTLEKFTNDLTPVINDLAVNMKTHISVLKGIDKSFKKFNNLLTQKDLRKWL